MAVAVTTRVNRPPQSCEACGKDFPKPRSGRARWCPSCRMARAALAKKLSYARRKGCEVPGEGMMPCTVCGAQMSKRRANKKYCDACRVQARRLTNDRYGRKVRNYRKPVGGNPFCQDCHVSKGGHGTFGRYCEICANIRLEKGESFWHWRASGGKAQSIGGVMSCSVCGTETPIKRVGQACCPSSKCKATWNRQTAGERGRVANLMRCYINRALQGKKKGRSWQKLVGYSLEELMDHLERQFLPGMSWDNRGRGWHIDHIRPLSSFAYTNADDPQFREAWALTNLRPLWARDNQRKYAKRVYLI